MGVFKNAQDDYNLRMSIFKKIIMKEWTASFLGAVAVLFIMVTTADLISGMLRESVTALQVVKNYVLKLPFLFSKLLPISCLIATLFSLNKLQTKNELVAMLASGFSRFQFILTIFQLGLVVALFQFLVLAYAEPYSKSLRSTWLPNSAKKFNKSKRLKTSGLLKGGYFWFKTPQYFLQFSNFNKYKNSLHDISLYFYDKDIIGTEIVQAKKATYTENNQWILEEGKQYTGTGGKQFAKLTLFDKQTFTLNEEPDDFKQIEADISTLEVVQLYSYIQHLKKSDINTNEYELILFDKFSSTLMCILFALFSTRSLFNPNRRSASFSKNAIFTFVFTLIYWLFYSFALDLGNSGKVPVLVATFGIPLIFLTYLSVEFYQHRKL